LAQALISCNQIFHVCRENSVDTFCTKIIIQKLDEPNACAFQLANAKYAIKNLHL
jgi:hypothetical protein